MEIRRLIQDSLTLCYQKHPDKVVAIFSGKEYLYRDLYNESQNIAHYLHSNGFQRGDRGAVFIENSWNILASVFGILYAGGTFLVINHLTKQDKLSYILTDSGATHLFSDTMVSKHFIPAVEKCNNIKAVIYAGKPIDALTQTPLLPIQTIHQKPLSPDSEIPCQNISMDLAALIYTSGSTGDPKGVMMSHANMVFTCDSLVEYLRLNEESKIFCFLPFAFDYGLYQIFMTIRLGACIVIEKSFAFPGLIFDEINSTEATVFPGVPTVFSTLINMYQKKPFSLPSITCVTNTAAALPADYVPILKNIFPNALIFKMYGLTECKRVCYLEPERIDSKASSVGKAIPGTEVLLLDPSGAPVGPDQEGTLYVRGQHVMQGYWNKPEQTEQMLRTDIVAGEKVLCTNDRFIMDSEGLLYFRGRTDEIIKTRGEKVSPIEVENVLHSMPGIKEAAVIGIPDPVEGQVIKAFVSLDRDTDIHPRQIRQYCIARLENFMVPKETIIMDELPKTNSNKINKMALNPTASPEDIQFEDLLSSLKASLEILSDKPDETCEITLKALWAFAQEQPISSAQAYSFSLSPLSEQQRTTLDEAIRQRISGTPLAHITGRQQFMGLEMLASKDALIPRKETEILANLAIDTIKQLPAENGITRVIDVCTGSGNLALGILNKCPDIKIWGADLSEEAIALANRNAGFSKLSDKIKFESGDLLAPFESPDFYQRVDVIICNPPYIISSNIEKMPDEISNHEPELAFNGGPFGIKILDRIIKDAKKYLSNNGWLCLEVGAGQAPFIEKRLKKSGSYQNIESICDKSGTARAIRAQFIIE